MLKTGPPAHPPPARLVELRRMKRNGELDPEKGEPTADRNRKRAALKQLKADEQAYFISIFGAEPPDLDAVDVFVVFFSGGFDWPCTPPYCRAVAEAFGLKLLFSRRLGGFKAEMTKQNDFTKHMVFELVDGGQSTSRLPSASVLAKREEKIAAGEGGTRMKFPAKSASLMERWCSAYLKIDVGRSWLGNDPHFKGKTVVTLTGERAAESTSRAFYSPYEPHERSLKGAPAGTPLEDKVQAAGKNWWRWRAVHDWDEERVWDAIERYRINPHVGYKLGWGRLSCMTCIFGDHNQWAATRDLDPQRFEMLGNIEQLFGAYWRANGLPNFKGTIDAKLTVHQMADRGRSFVPRGREFERLQRIALDSGPYAEDIIVPARSWKLPPGAFKEGGGPT